MVKYKLIERVGGILREIQNMWRTLRENIGEKLLSWSSFYNDYSFYILYKPVTHNTPINPDIKEDDEKIMAGWYIIYCRAFGWRTVPTVRGYDGYDEWMWGILYIITYWFTPRANVSKLK